MEVTSRSASLVTSDAGLQAGTGRKDAGDGQRKDANRPRGDLVCLSHLRWNFVFQRPNHLMVRFARRQRVFFVEEPIFEDRSEPELECRPELPGLTICVPHLPAGMDESTALSATRELLEKFYASASVVPEVVWLYTPMALPLLPRSGSFAVVYDCMDELSGFLGAPKHLLALEAELLGRADLVFTGGVSIYEAKRSRHPSVHAFPSSVDREHFARAREPLEEPPDQAAISHPRVGYFGVIDERMDLALLETIARTKPEWSVVIVGPVVKIDPQSLPRLPNLHFLGMKSYAELPGYLAGWDVALMPFALNEATRFISPTKTLEYLAAGRPIVSTPIQDVVRPYGELGLVRIAEAPDFVSEIEAALREQPEKRRNAADEYVARTSWDSTWKRMADLIDARLAEAPREETTCSTT
jgi:UDP-galactopyranose mutase